jgi:hypothetical protein
MRQDDIKNIRAACTKANPDIEEEFGCSCGSCDYETRVRPIRLADVLLAVENGRSAEMTEEKIRILRYIASIWNLRTDDLEQQSDETVEFISSLLEI